METETSDSEMEPGSTDMRNLVGERSVNVINVRRKKQLRVLWLVFGFLLLLGGMAVSVYFLSTNQLPSTRSLISTTVHFTMSTAQPSTETTTSPTTTESPECSVSDLDKLDCHPDAGLSKETCISRQCCYVSDETSDNIPQCYYPIGYNGYEVDDITDIGSILRASLKRLTPSGFPKDVPVLSVIAENIDENNLHIKITDSANTRYEAPLFKSITRKEIKADVAKYDVALSPDGILSVLRVSSNVTIFQTNLRSLLYSDQFLQLRVKLPSHILYGLGETYQPLLKDMDWSQSVFFNKDNFPGPHLNLYGTHPFYLSLENTNDSHGLFLLNSNAMDVTVSPAPSVTFRTIGGILDLFLFLGPTPHEVVKQYTEVVGKPMMPPYWGLGFHLSKSGYNSLNETRRVYQKTKDAEIPYDVQWGDIDVMHNHNDFTYNKVEFDGLPEFVKELHEEGMHYVLMFDPGISNTEPAGTYAPYDEGIEDDIFVKNNTGDIFIGKVWNPISTVFPDFTHPNATVYWTRQMQYFHKVIEFDGAGVDMNEISNFYYNGTVDGCPDDSSWENPPYLPSGVESLYTKTLCMTAKHYNTLHYNVHNTYGYWQAIATNNAMINVTGKRPFVISRATFSGQGHFSGHWSGDIASTWEDMRYSVTNMLAFNMYGIPLVGSDICGCRLNVTAELCARWFALGAFYPFSRNHNDVDQVDQDPTSLGHDVLTSAKKNLYVRYSLLPYLYYLFYHSHVFGDTVVRPLFFEFHDDPYTYAIEEQFLWGPNLMIMPALYQGVKEITVYFPKGTWYDFYTYEERMSKGENVTLPAPLDSINIAIRSSSILVLQNPGVTTTKSRQDYFILLVAVDKTGDSVGELYWDDGESIGNYENKNYNLLRFLFHNNTLTSEVIHSGYDEEMTLGSVKIFAIDSEPKNVFINDTKTDFNWTAQYKILDITPLNLTLLEPLSINISY